MHKFLVDESAGRKLFLYLKEKGFDAQYVGDIMPRALDYSILEFAEKEDRVLVTNDKDFGELVFRAGKPSSGVILLRLRLDSPKKKQLYLSYVLDNFYDKLEASFIVVSEGKVRIRRF